MEKEILIPVSRRIAELNNGCFNLEIPGFPLSRE